MTEALRLLAVFAHPDDESMGMGGTLAKYSAEGVETYLVCATRGERGWFGPEEQNPGLSALGQLRTKELENAVQELGMKGLYFLDAIDGEVDQSNPAEAIGKIVSHIRRIKPQVVVTFPPDGNYGHPDHIAVGQFAQAAILCSADSSYQDVENLQAHRVLKLYLSFSKGLIPRRSAA
jgi:LmbE family N-acetylglucosaminyl deacetylase